MRAYYDDRWGQILSRGQRRIRGDRHFPAIVQDMSLSDRYAYAVWAVAQQGKSLGVLSSLGAQGALDLHAAWNAAGRTGQYIPTVFIDTGYQHKETLDYRKTLDKTGYTVITYKPLRENRRELRKLARQYCDVWAENDRSKWGEDATKAFDEFAELAKREPLRRATQALNVGVWTTGRRRAQSEARAELPVFRFEDGILVEFNPLADWTTKEVYNYMGRHDLPHHPLVQTGASSIGYEWEPLHGKGECGLHGGQEQTGRIVDVVGKPLLLEAG